MSSPESITEWLQQLLERNREAVPKLWAIYFPRLVGLSRKKLYPTPTQAAEGEDVALSVFMSFCRCAQEGRFPRLADRDDLWQLLVLITARKVCNQIRHEGRRRPRVGRLLHASALADENRDDTASVFAAIIRREPDPAFAVGAASEDMGHADWPGSLHLGKAYGSCLRRGVQPRRPALGHSEAGRHCENLGRDAAS